MAAKKKQQNCVSKQTTDKPKRRRVKVKAGQIVAVPLRDGTYALGHVAHYHYLQIILAHFAHRAETAERLREGMEVALKSGPIALLAMTNVDIYDGNWPIIGEKEPQYPAAMLDMKGQSYHSSMAYWLLGAYYGLVPWDGMKDPRFYEKVLLPGVAVPSTVRYKRDFERDTALKAEPVTATEAESEPAVTEGPGEIHIEIKYEGEGLPSIPLLKRRQAMEEAISSAGVGEITDAGGGGGVMDIFLETEDVARALPVLRAAIQQAGFEDTARVEVTALDHEGDEDDPEEATEEEEAP